MSNERLAGHALAAFSGLLASAVLVPTGSGDGTGLALLGLAATLGLVAWNMTALGVRATTHDGRWALGNAALVAVAFIGSLLALDAGHDFTLTATPNLWVHFVLALFGGSVLVANDHRARRA